MVELKPFPGVTERMGSPLGWCQHEPSTRKEGSETAPVATHWPAFSTMPRGPQVSVPN